ncbi:MAG TPA: DUF3800 domain-containing protein [Candidatus Paceibacterota bacterium]|nr:DUF3800 domain-containing protein [Candidatus Paceibacterota bacterium]
MRYIFVDESRISKGRYQLFGSLWLPREKRDEFERTFWQLWDREFPTRRSELKWTKVSKGKLETYQRFIDFFSEFPMVDFRCVVLDTHAIDYQVYHNNDAELGFYKFLYFFLSRNIEKDYIHRGVRESYQIFVDRRRKENGIEVGRLEDLKRVLKNRLDDTCAEVLSPCVRNVEAVDSKESPEVQIVDMLMGAVGYAWEGFETSPAKLIIVEHIEQMFGLKLNRQTPYLSEKINIWKFRLQDKKKSAPRPTPPERG